MSYKIPQWANHEKLRLTKPVIQYFGLGFVQVKTSDTERYHYYHPDVYSSICPEAIHNHRYNFISHVMKGIINQSLYEIVIPGDSYILTDESCAPNTDDVQPETKVGARKTAEVRLLAGSSYFLQFHQLHQISYTGKTITQLTRELPYLQTTAQVLTPTGEQKVCPFQTHYSEPDLWDIVKDTILD